RAGVGLPAGAPRGVPRVRVAPAGDGAARQRGGSRGTSDQAGGMPPASRRRFGHGAVARAQSLLSRPRSFTALTLISAPAGTSDRCVRGSVTVVLRSSPHVAR